MNIATNEIILPYLELISNSSLKEKCIALYNHHKKAIYYAPAGASHHHSFIGGWATHTTEVIALAISMYDMLISSNVKLPFDKDDVILVSFIHDLEKIDRYVLTTDDWKKKKGIMWEVREGLETMDDSARVVAMVAHFDIHLNDMQISAISCHHGGFSTRLSSVFSYVGSMNKLGVLLHSADLMSGFILGRK